MLVLCRLLKRGNDWGVGWILPETIPKFLSFKLSSLISSIFPNTNSHQLFFAKLLKKTLQSSNKAAWTIEIFLNGHSSVCYMAEETFRHKSDFSGQMLMSFWFQCSSKIDSFKQRHWTFPYQNENSSANLSKLNTLYHLIVYSTLNFKFSVQNFIPRDIDSRRHEGPRLVQTSCISIFWQKHLTLWRNVHFIFSL